MTQEGDNASQFLELRGKLVGYLARLLPVNQYVTQISNTKQQEQRILWWPLQI